MEIRTAQRRIVQIALATWLAVTSFAPVAWTQESAEEMTAPTPIPEATPIPASEIPTQAGKVNASLREIAGRTEVRENVKEIQNSLEKQTENVEFLEQETRDHVRDVSARWSLEELQNRWLREKRVIADWSQILRKRTEELEADVQTLREMRDLWQLTLDHAEEQELPDVLRVTVTDTLTAIASTREVVNARRDDVLTIQAEVSRLESRVGEAMEPVRQGLRSQSRSLLIPERPPIWRTPWTPDGEDSVADRIRQARKKDFLSIKKYLIDQSTRGAGQILLLLVLSIAFWSLGRRAGSLEDPDASLQATTVLLQRSVASAVLISVLADGWFHPSPPFAWSDLMGLVLLAAMCRLLPPILPRNYRPALIILVLLYLVLQFAVMLPQELAQFRLVLMVLAAATGGSLAWLIDHVDDVRQARYPRWLATAIVACKAGIGLMGISILANIIGNAALASVLVYGILVSIYCGVLYWTGTLVLEGAFAILLRTGTAQKLIMVQDHKTTVLAAFENLINFGAVALWVRSTLWGFGLLEGSIAYFNAAYEAEISLFGTSFRPFAIVPILIVVYLTFKVSKFVRFVLDKDVLPKFSFPRGVPNTILTITHYIVLLIGFFLVVTMSGISLDKFTIIAGALGVGVGFGLQNIVNNFVSGLILLFERPISEGDKIQVGTVSGRVEQIGIRASIVRTWQGAEVIVPNADLISKELVNWTLYDMRRRIEIPIGVAYGTNPETVIELLSSVATGHPEVLDDPAPSVPFLGFGASSLDFELRAWTLEDFVRVGSELRIQITRTLAEKGIEIPFPQRDIHLRSPDGGGEATAQIPMSISHGADEEGTSGPGIDFGDDDR